MTEQANPLTLEQAIAVLNEKRWRGRDDWNHHAFDFIRSMGGTSDLELLLQADDAIGVAIGLLAQDRIAELERENTRLKEALADMIDLATLLDDDDPYFGERRNATERIEKARAVNQ